MVNTSPDSNLAATAKSAGQAAATSAANAIVVAVVNASKPGGQTTEFKATVVTVVLSGLLAGLQIFAAVPGPWTVPAMLALAGLTVASATYTASRGSVKKAALAGAAALAVAAVRPPGATIVLPASTADDDARQNAG